MTCYNELLKMGVTELYNKGKITAQLQTDLNTYIDGNVLESYKRLEYLSFDEVNSTGTTFDSATRIISNTTAAVLRTVKMTGLIGKTLISFKLISDVFNDPSFSFSYDQLTWYNLSSENINELISADFYLKINYTTASDVTGLYILYK